MELVGCTSLVVVLVVLDDARQEEENSFVMFRQNNIPSRQVAFEATHRHVHTCSSARLSVLYYSSVRPAGRPLICLPDRLTALSCALSLVWPPVLSRVLSLVRRHARLPAGLLTHPCTLRTACSCFSRSAGWLALALALALSLSLEIGLALALALELAQEADPSAAAETPGGKLEAHSGALCTCLHCTFQCH